MNPILTLFPLILLLLTACTTLQKPPTTPPAPGEMQIHYYSFNPQGLHGQSILNGESLNDTRLPKNGIPLTKDETRTLMAQIFPQGAIRPPSFCLYDPRDAFVFFDHNKTIIGHLDVCFSCNEFESAFDPNKLQSLSDEVHALWRKPTMSKQTIKTVTGEQTMMTESRTNTLDFNTIATIIKAVKKRS